MEKVGTGILYFSDLNENQQRATIPDYKKLLLRIEAKTKRANYKMRAILKHLETKDKDVVIGDYYKMEDYETLF